MRLFVAVLCLAGCGRVAFDRLDDAGTGDVNDGGSVACTGPFTNVEEVTVLNSDSLDWAPHESADGLTVYFGSARSGDVDLYRATRPTLGASWSAPSVIPELAMGGDEEDNAAPSSDELEMYFGRTSIYRVERAAVTLPWTARTLAIAPGTMFASPQGPFLSVDALRLYVTGIAGPNYDLFVIERANRDAPFLDTNASPLTELNTFGEDGWPSLTDDELTIYFTSDAGGSLDIWTATRASRAAPFGTARLVEVVNSPDEEYDPQISRDGKTLWFSSNRKTGVPFNHDIYVATRSCL